MTINVSITIDGQSFRSFLKRILVSRGMILILLIMLSLVAFADTVSKPYTFAAGDIIKAEDINANFDALYSEVNGNLTDANIKAGANIAQSKIAGAPFADQTHEHDAAEITSGVMDKARLPGRNYAYDILDAQFEVNSSGYTKVSDIETNIVTNGNDILVICALNCADINSSGLRARICIDNTWYSPGKRLSIDLAGAHYFSLSLMHVFTSIPAGNHTISIEVKNNASNGSRILSYTEYGSSLYVEEL